MAIRSLIIDNHPFIHTLMMDNPGRQFLEEELRLPLKDIIQVQGERFFRCHQSCLVHGFRIEYLINQARIRLSNLGEISISHRKKSSLRQLAQPLELQPLNIAGSE